MAENLRNRPGRVVDPELGRNGARTSGYGLSVTEVTSQRSLSTLMSSTTAVNVQSTACEPSVLGTHFATKAVPSTAAVVPPGLHLERAGLGDLGRTVPGLAHRERALGLATALLVGELGDGEDGRVRQTR